MDMARIDMAAGDAVNRNPPVPARRSAMRVLVTRPIEDCDRTVAALASRGHAAVVAPLFAVEPLAGVLADGLAAGVDAVVATSANAIRNAPRDLAALAGLPMFAVGSATAEAARTAGFAAVHAGAGDGAALAALAAESLRPGARLLYLAGSPRRDEALAALSARFAVTVAETYRTIAVPVLPAAAVEALTADSLDAVLHFSPRAARVFADLAVQAKLMPQARRLLHVFISRAAMEPRLAEGRIAVRPSLESMIDAL
jgi:uroporphyrinogen-III synthase